MTKYLPQYGVSVTSDGQVINSIRTTSGSLDSGGYLSAYTRLQGCQLVHKLIAEAFLGPRPEGKWVHHINGNKIDNRLKNLEYITPRDNSIRDKKERNGRIKGYQQIGCNSWCARIRYKGQRVYLGSFKLKEDASAAYWRAVEAVRRGERPLSAPKRRTRWSEIETKGVTR